MEEKVGGAMINKQGFERFARRETITFSCGYCI